ncbi:MAG: sel1 repeat family protein [Lacunisphaera sp.]|nr:sel1 repeat family protein [Lacunisphaera sp.]
MAAEQGHRAAQYKLGLMYANGEGVNQDEIEANKWHRRATDHRVVNQDYDYDLGKKPTETVEWYRKAAEKGNASAQNNLGIIYANGIGVAQNRTDAEKWYRKAAEQGHYDAQFYLGQMYADGDGVLVNNSEAVKWFRKAALRFHSGALPKLALKYYYGDGVTKCEIEGLAWFIYKTKVGRDTYGHEEDMKTRAWMEAALGREKTLVAQKRSREISDGQRASRYG